MRFFTCLPGFLSGLLFLTFLDARAQGLYKIPAEEKIDRSTLIVEGKVTDKRSFWNEQHTMIYTTNRVEVYKIFKGALQKDEIEVVTLGGAVGNYYIHASHLLELEKEDIGVFFCEQEDAGKIKPPVSTGPLYRVYSSSQGFLKYNLLTGTASAPFARYDDIEKELYKELREKTGRSPEIRKPSFDIRKASQDIQNASNSILAPAISSFSPGIVHGGALLDPANNVLTIRGTGFGSPSSTAAVLFPHADKGSGTDYTLPSTNELVISWTDTEIKLKVPMQAATGTFKVRDNTGAVTSSPAPLEVLYTVLTADFGSPYGIKQYTLGNINGNGGYNLKYSTSTANSGININASDAKATFQRALNTWKESVGVNFVEAGNSSLQMVAPDDGENMIMFDNSATGLPDGPLAAGVLATCFSGTTICTDNPANNQAQKSGFDIVIRNMGFSIGSTALTFGPCPPYSLSGSAVDLESVLLHELGHALNLGHIIDPLQGSGAGTATPSKVMNYSVAFNLRRISLDYAAKAGALYMITPHNYTYGNCVPASPEMKPLTVVTEPKDECPTAFPTSTTSSNTTVNFDLVHATSNKLTDPAYNQMTTNGTGANITNTAFYAIKTNGLGGELTMEVRNYSTSPEEIGACMPGVTGIQVTGVKLSVYQVAGCPAGGSFPTPLAYYTFNANGALSSIGSLPPNTTYLVVVDGIQNTKARFDITFSGSALEVRTTDLDGTVFTTYNLLNWTTDTSFPINNMFLERSSDGVTFERLTEISGTVAQGNGEFTDEEPLPGNNYYRLALKNTDGSFDYSETLLLTRTEESNNLNVYPNPVTGQDIQVQLLNITPGVYVLNFYNIYGSRVMTRQITAVSASHKETVPVYLLARGVYFLSVTGQDKKKIGSARFIIP